MAKKKPAADAAKGADIVLIGSSILAAVMMIAGREVQLGEVVARAHAESGMTAEEWNAQSGDDREARIAAAIEIMESEPPVDPVKPPATKPAKTPNVELPASIKLKRPHGFIDDKGNNRYWFAGVDITNQDDIALLIERKAEID